MIEYLETVHQRRIAFVRTPRRTEGPAPGLVFLGGFMSDMSGTKARHLESWARARGRAFLRFDYSGHGESSGGFDEGCIGDWAEDAADAIGALTQGPQILVGSSMGGWIALLAARSMEDRLAGLVTIAAAPDFTEDSIWAGFSEAQKASLAGKGRVLLPSDYGDGPYVITRRMIEDGRNHLVLRTPLVLRARVRMLQGTADADVDLAVALRLLDHLEAEDSRLTLVKGADHRFSSPACLALIEAAIEDVSG